MGPRLDDSLLDDIYASIVVRGDYSGAVSRLSTLFKSHSGAVLRRDGDTLQFVRMHNLCPSLMADSYEVVGFLDQCANAIPHAAAGHSEPQQQFA